jgi:hypothetical protein
MAQGWRDALKLAKTNLDQTPAAPPWLAQAVAAAQNVAPALEPPPVREETAPEFFYPH